MQSNTTGGQNVAIGRDTLTSNTTASQNVAVGYLAMEDNTTGTRNVAVGYFALYNNTTNNDNTAVGHYALAASNGGYENTAVGRNALASCSTGNANTAVGVQALNNTTTAANNTMVGMYAGLSNTTGSHNVGVGYMALYGVTTGGDNVAVGKQALQDVTTGSNNMAFGLDAGRAGTPTGSITTASNYICMGNNSHTDFACRVSLTVTSDKRDKTDITDFNHGLSWINKLRPVTYKWDMRSNYENGVPDGSKKEPKLFIGLIAQEELEVEKEHGFANDKDDMLITTENDEGNYGMEYDRIVPILINAVKELSAKNDALEARIKTLEG